MIEAVNSVLQTAQFVRAQSEQASAVDSFAANPERVQKAPQAPYISPYIHVDINYNKAVLQLRNGETGDVENQFPTKSQMEAQARAAARRDIENDRLAEPKKQSESAQAFVQGTSSKTEGTTATASGAGNISQQQQAAFAAAARAGNVNAGHVTLFA